MGVPVISEQPFWNVGSPDVPTTCIPSGASMLCARFAVPALVAFVALVALSALLACSAFGTVSPLVLIFFAVTAPFLIFFVVTAFFLSCLLPTLFFGTLNAYAVPPRAITSAMIETTRAGLGRPRWNLRI